MGAYVSVTNDVADCKMWMMIGPNQVAAKWALAGLTGVASGFGEGTGAKTGLASELLVPLFSVVGDSIDVAYTETAMAAFAKKKGYSPDLQSVTMPFLDEYARKELLLNGAPGFGGFYKSRKVSLSLLMQANTMAVCKTGSNTADMYLGNFDVWAGSTDGARNNYYLSRELKRLKKTQLRFRSIATQLPVAALNPGRGRVGMPKITRRTVVLEADAAASAEVTAEEEDVEVAHISDLD